MKLFKLLIVLLFISGAGISQTLETGTVLEYKLPAEDNNTGTFYLGKFQVGKYEISANIGGIHANNTGWKIYIGSNWGGSNRIFKEIYNNVTGKGAFYYQKDGNGYFHLWWDANYGSGGYNWTPHIKVEYQIGGCVYDNLEPERTNAITLTNNGTQNVRSLIVSAQTSGDAILKIESDIDNNNEGDNPMIQLRQDGGSLGVNIGFNESGFGGNIFGISRRYGDSEYNNVLLMNTANGNISIGKSPSSAKLDVAGNIKAQEIEVTLASMQDLNLNGTLAANNITYTANGQTADHVFEADYNLRSLEEIEAFILENKHLPDVPSAAAMEEQGVNLAEMNKLLLQKVEELTLYIIQQEKKFKEMNALKERLEKIETLINK